MKQSSDQALSIHKQQQVTRTATRTTKWTTTKKYVARKCMLVMENYICRARELYILPLRWEWRRKKEREWESWWLWICSLWLEYAMPVIDKTQSRAVQCLYFKLPLISGRMTISILFLHENLFCWKYFCSLSLCAILQCGFGMCEWVFFSSLLLLNASASLCQNRRSARKT